MNVSQQDYLKSILSIEMGGEQATVGLLSEQLSVKPASVTEMIKKLAELDLLVYKKYKGFKLTPKGKTQAIRILRKHRLWETFLYRILQFPLSEIHREAETFEHHISGVLESRIDEILGFPKYDPHGHPIPTLDGELQLNSNRKDVARLSYLQSGDRGIVIQISDAIASFLNYLEESGLSLYKTITVAHKHEFDQSMEIAFDDNTLFLSREMTENILVRLQPNNAQKEENEDV